ncbi:choice-of-anchor D domain-containing protein [Actinocatenispora sera]|uniref:WD40 repeat protein n=1 Tax=Actinocatenispora sera TaxID=390989 RepID=A0A810L9F0_9ACTN|nr:choice-of-anchor D domain-containing protein [Actinocatenispora sera]BCJ31903.1 hypothetical protein Asera_60110 [Actinocatenispora sera]
MADLHHTAPGRRGRWLRGVAATVVLAMLGAALGGGAASSAPETSGHTILVGSGTIPIPSGTGSGTALSADGRYLANPSGTAGQPSRVHLADLQTGTQQTISPAGDAASAPSVSSDGALVTYQVDDDATSTAGIETWRRSGDGTPQQVTGTARDLQYERAVPCVGAGADAIDPCGPRLSGDGNTVVYPVLQTARSPYLRLSTDAVQTSSVAPGPRTVTAAASQLAADPVLDFGSAYADGTVVTLPLHVTVIGSGQPGVGSLRIPASIRPSTPMPAGAGFGFADEDATPTDTSDACRPVAVGATCTLWISYTADTREHPCAARYATLTLRGSTPAGQSALALVARNAAGDCRAVPSECAPTDPARPDTVSASVGTDNAGTTLLDLGARPAGGTYVASYTIHNTLGEPALVDVEGSDCSLTQLGGAAGLYPRCGNSAVATGGDCALVVVYRPRRDTFPPSVLRVTLSTAAGWGGGPTTTTLVVGSTSQYGVVARRDPSGHGDFAAANSTVVSTNDGGAAIDGREPAVSADGRYVAFRSHRATTTATQPTDLVYLHDTHTGNTALVSRLPATGSTDGPVAHSAHAPTLSADGSRVAFEAQGTDQDTGQIYLRDRTNDRTMLVSAAVRSGVGANGPSSRPALSADGSTVAWQSTATDLVTVPVPVEGGLQVYARNLGTARTGPAGTELISTSPAGNGQDPAISADGGVVGFRSTDTVHSSVASARQPVTFLARLRYASPSTSPTHIAFDPQPAGTTSLPRTVRVRNAGPGPLHAGIGVTGPFRILDSDCGSAIHAAESCTLDIVFEPTASGDLNGLLTVSPLVFGVPIDGSASVTLSGAGAPVSTGLRAAPYPLELGSQQLGVASDRVALALTNTGTVPLTVTAAFLPGRGPAQFGVTAGSCRGSLAPGAGCHLFVRVTPRRLGRLSGELAVSGSAGPTGTAQLVPVSATTRTPVLALNPMVVRPHDVVTLTGRYFPPGTTVRIGGVRSSAVDVDTDRSGTFAVPVVLLGDERTGVSRPRALVAGVGSVTGPPLLVQAASSQPNRFDTRR